MNATAKPGLARPAQAADPADAHLRVDALAAGSCSQDQFLREVHAQSRKDPDVIWETLAVLDQHFRSGKISPKLFKAIKPRLEQSALGPGDDVPVLRPEPESAPVPDAGHPVWTLRVGDVLRDRYRIIGILGRGRTGTVVEAIDEHGLDIPDARQRVAIRVLDTAALERSDQLAGLMRQVGKLQALSHPNILRVFDLDQHRNVPFLSMELLRGDPLPRFIEQQQQDGKPALGSPAALKLVRHIASALACAHSNGLFHGDVRAENVFITRRKEVRLLGFETAAMEGTARLEKDHLSFAWFAYDLLSAAGAGKPTSSTVAQTTKLRKPRGLSGEQWNVLRNTLLGKEPVGSHNVLSVFGADEGALTEGLQAPERLNVRSLERAGNSLRITGWLVAILLIGAAGYAFVSRNTSSTSGITKELFKASDQFWQFMASVTHHDDASTGITANPDRPAEGLPATSATVAPANAAATNESRAAAAPSVAGPPAPAFTRAHIALPSDAMEVDDRETAARITVRRRGRLSGPVSFVWWTETGSAKSDEDFGAVLPRREVIEDGADRIELFVPLVSNSLRTQPRTFYVKLDEAGPGSVLDGETLMQVTILPASGAP
jgi:serine/threonine protein kinase